MVCKVFNKIIFENILFQSKEMSLKGEKANSLVLGDKLSKKKIKKKENRKFLQFLGNPICTRSSPFILN